MFQRRLKKEPHCVFLEQTSKLAIAEQSKRPFLKLELVKIILSSGETLHEKPITSFLVFIIIKSFVYEMKAHAFKSFCSLSKPIHTSTPP